MSERREETMQWERGEERLGQDVAMMMEEDSKEGSSRKEMIREFGGREHS